MTFNFNCWAVVRAEMEEGEIDFLSVIGFCLSADEAEGFARADKELDRAREDKRVADLKKQFGACRWEPRYNELQYAFIPLHAVTFDGLSDLENKLEDAARLQFVGIGKVA